MATLEDAKALQERVWDFVHRGELDNLRALLEEHPDVDVDGFKNRFGRRALYWACACGYTECARLLIDHRADVRVKCNDSRSALGTAAANGHLSCVRLLLQNGADVNCQTNIGLTPLMGSAYPGHLAVAQYLLEQKADIHYCVSNGGSYKNTDALYWTMHENTSTPGSAFAFLSCDSDAKNVVINNNVSIAMRDAHIEEYKHVQAFIDEHHRILNLVLSDHVQVDTRVGRGDSGIYQEPLERTLEYLGLSMKKDQVVNASIDGGGEEGEEGGVKRALIPGHLLNANHWFDKCKSRLNNQLNDLV
jgi:hypothetical protein